MNLYLARTPLQRAVSALDLNRRSTDINFGMGKRPAHIVMLPSSMSGHFGPFLHFLYCLKEPQYSGVKVTVFSGAPRFKQLLELQSDGEFQGLDLRLEEMIDPLVIDGTGSTNGSLELPVARKPKNNWEKSFKPHQERLLQEKNAANAPTCILCDQFFHWIQDVAEELGIPWYPICTAPAWFFLACTLVAGLQRQGLLQYDHPEHKNRVVRGMEWVKVVDFPRGVIERCEKYEKQSERFSQATALVVNTSEELDDPTGARNQLHKQLQTRAANGQAPRIFLIGPLLQMPGFSKVPVAAPPARRAASLEWLDNNQLPPSSVLYVCFGSMDSTTREAMTELAHGLMASEVPFLWVTKATESELATFLPPDFQVRNKGRGFIETSWAPQTDILLHPCIGGYLTHCGWNSVMEGLGAGLPFVTWPLDAEQSLNAVYLRSILKVGIAINNMEGTDYSRVSRSDVASAVKSLMLEAQGRECRQAAEKVKGLLESAVSEGGSSHRDLQSFLGEITTPQSNNMATTF